MNKLFDMFTSKERTFIVEEDKLLQIIHMIQRSLYSGLVVNGMRINQDKGNKDNKNWSINVDLTNKQWYSLLEECKKYGYIIVISNDQNMYFHKNQESE